MEININDQLFISRKWNKYNCKEEALKYNSKPEYKQKSQYSYKIAYLNGWLDEICSHMICKNKHNFWTKEKCIEIAQNYISFKEFRINNLTAYSIILKNKWSDEICSHLKRTGSLYKRCIYVYEFNDNSAYIGLTLNLNTRDKEHNTNINSQVYKHKIKTNLKPMLKQLTEYIDKDEARLLEIEFIEIYKNNNWNILNVAKGGNLGKINNTNWTINMCHDIALKYKSKSEFAKNNSHAYYIARKNKWLNDICSHMIIFSKPFGYWTYDKCKDEALKYKNKKEFSENNRSAYIISHKNKWLNDICSHMIKIKPDIFWTYDKCKDEALKYTNRSQFKRKNSSAYIVANKNKWLDSFYKLDINNI